jgi:hypothetical protein
MHLVVEVREATRLPGDMAHHLGSETIVSEEDVADTGDQYSGRDIAFDPAVTCS